ncbi:hypothetical protein BJ508DRAFT_335880 [Ascobolus immersus RN42]|uniref:C2H2-type domain-containing protein n=1 Tax=Ascobolus immersus RN42 TaxID=1160509 RepID=A0A3N4HFC0_ASCIM|nr:hypothetical protein BJ508DRAFT_335880 [Ascobolus immersus RN42]
MFRLVRDEFQGLVEFFKHHGIPQEDTDNRRWCEFDELVTLYIHIKSRIGQSLEAYEQALDDPNADLVTADLAKQRLEAWAMPQFILDRPEPADGTIILTIQVGPAYNPIALETRRLRSCADKAANLIRFHKSLSEKLVPWAKLYLGKLTQQHNLVLRQAAFVKSYHDRVFADFLSRAPATSTNANLDARGARSSSDLTAKRTTGDDKDGSGKRTGPIRTGSVNPGKQWQFVPYVPTPSTGLPGSSASGRTATRVAQPFAIVDGKKQYSCDLVLADGTVCGRKFGASGDLNKHKRTFKAHTSLPALDCPFCFSFKGVRKDILQRHIRDFHPGQQ